MSVVHDYMAHGTARLLLSQLRNGSATWATDRLTETATYWHGMADWPRPDIAFEDQSTGASLALEFKPPAQTKREYITGLGQALSYLQDFEFSALVVPRSSYDNFPIADYLSRFLAQSYLASAPLALFSYDRQIEANSDLEVMVPLKPRPGDLPPIPKGIGRKVFWGYWRDLSQYDTFAILSTMDSRTAVFDKAFARFWKNIVMKGKGRTWEGAVRHISPTPVGSSRYQSELLNCRLSLRHAELIDSVGRLTDSALGLIQCGKVYGPDSQAFIRMLSRLLLQSGNHLELIFWVEEQQRSIDPTNKQSASSYYNALDAKLREAGVIPLSTGTAKPNFIRDEPKLWNKLGFLEHGKGRYFHKGHGLLFDWRRIISCIGELSQENHPT